MLDDDQDKDMVRRQMRAMLLIGAILMGWMYLFQPEPVVQDPPPQEGAEEIAADDAQRVDRDERTSSADVAETGGAQWPNLPAIPEVEDPADDEVVLENDDIKLVFTRIGGRLKQASVIKGGTVAHHLIPDNPELADTETIYPLGLRFTHSDIGDELDYRRYDVEMGQDLQSVTFTLDVPGSMRVEKRFAFNEKHYVLDVDVSYTNLEGATRRLGMDLEPAYTLNWGPAIQRPEGDAFFTPSVLWYDAEEGEMQKEYLNDFPDAGKQPENRRVPDVNWIGSRTKYFLVAFQNRAEETPIDGWMAGTVDRVRFGASVPRQEIAPGDAHNAAFQMYIGPMHLAEVDAAWPTLITALTFFDWPGFMDSFAKLLLTNLNWWYGFFGTYGVSIVLLTVTVRLVMLPLTLKSMKSMKAMQSLGPQLQELKEKHGDDQQAFAQAQMELFRETGVNPLGGCLPMLIQMPIFIALYRMILYSYEMRGEPFIWIKDLSQPDALFQMPFLEPVPLVGPHIQNFNVLPILMVIAMVFSMKLTTSTVQTPQQQMMMRIMPIFFGVISYPFSAGINLYVLTSTVLGIVQQQIINRSKSQTLEAPKKKKKSLEEVRKDRKKHFYTRAQQQKREQAKEERRKKKKAQR